jgi:hypothetical protein
VKGLSIGFACFGSFCENNSESLRSFAVSGLIKFSEQLHQRPRRAWFCRRVAQSAAESVRVPCGCLKSPIFARFPDWSGQGRQVTAIPVCKAFHRQPCGRTVLLARDNRSKASPKRTKRLEK